MCDICGGSGLIPLRRKIDNSIVPFAWTYCECHQDEPEHEHSVRPEDIDYTLSFSHYRALCQEHGWQDPGSDYPLEPNPLELEPIEPKPQVISHIHFRSNMGKAQFDLLQQTARKAEYLEKTLIEHIKPKPKAQSKYGYRGIR